MSENLFNGHSPFSLPLLEFPFFCYSGGDAAMIFGSFIFLYFIFSI
jgi:hypothetical protein